ncbi:protein NEN1 [Cynara cardunculus var. scolymus]|uniref:protein NEN1 n=1 Tax=Cynara cardunculus var. scolymus TaxID=59895 RepID=UPI000D62EBE0|nr:protein NEN1 [Cynara cardunculus var. scolymus]
MVSTVDRSEIAFFDLETTIPTRVGQGYAILEFGSILVCPRKLIELESYDTLVRPHDLSLISTLSTRANGISADAVVSAPAFSDIADRVYDILHGRVWAGHNILRFDCVRLREAYAQINRPPPEPKGTIDSLALLTQRFGRRAGDMKMATLAAYFGLGRQSHRSLDDVRLNLEVLKYCATVLFLESSLPDIFTENNWASLNSTTSYRCNGKSTLEGTGSTTSPLSSSRNIENPTLPLNPTFSVVIPEEQIPNLVESGSARFDPFQMGQFVDEMEKESLQSNEAMVEESSTTTLSDAVSNRTEFIEPDEVSIASITVAVSPLFHGYQRMQMLHRDIPMQIRCDRMLIWFGLSTKFVDRLSFVVDANSSNLCGVLDACDDIAKRFVDPDRNSEWRPVVSRKPGFYNSPTVRLHLPTVAGDTTRWITEIYHQQSSLLPPTQLFVSGNYDVAELDALFRPGFVVDAYFSLDPYNYQQNAGIRLVAKKLIVHTN